MPNQKHAAGGDSDMTTLTRGFRKWWLMHLRAWHLVDAYLAENRGEWYAAANHRAMAYEQERQIALLEINHG